MNTPKRSFEAIFYNGFFKAELELMLKSQREKPSRRLFFQPYRKDLIKRLRDARPTPENPITIYFSTTDDRPTVSYQAEIVEWRNKQELDKTEWLEVNRAIREVEFNEGLFDIGINLIQIRNLVRLDDQYRVSELRKISDGQPLSEKRIWSGISFVYERT